MVIKMNEISVFLANNYIWFVIIDVFVLFGLIGYIYENKKKNNSDNTEVLDTLKMDKDNTVEELEVQLGDKANKSLNSVVNSINTNEEKKEETETLM